MPRRALLDDHTGIAELIARSECVLTRAELESAGVAGSTISYRTRADGPWQRPLPGIVVSHNRPLSKRERILCALKYAGAGACVTGITALREHGFRSAAHGSEVHILIPHGRHRLSAGFVAIERTRNDATTHQMNGIPLVEPARAVIDACRRLRRLSEVRGLISEAVQRKYTSVPAIRSELNAAAARGSALPRRVLREVQAGVRSAAEAHARELINGSRLPKPAWNVTLVKGRTALGTVDAYWAAYGVVLEIDSMEWHLSPDDYKRTQRRQRRLVSAGLIVVPITPADIMADPNGFIANLAETLDQAHGPVDGIVAQQAA
jgi:hypothetical protein